MSRIVILTDEDIAEGIIGMIGLIGTAYILNRIISAPPFIIGGMAFFISWYLRRIGVNIYHYFKYNHGFSIKPLTYNLVGY